MTRGDSFSRNFPELRQRCRERSAAGPWFVRKLRRRRVKMIRGDSFSRSFPGLGRRCRECSAGLRRSATHCGGIASNWNRLESLPRSSRAGRCPPRGEGGSKSLQTLGRVTARGLTRRFFIAPRTFDYFSEIKEFKRGDRDADRGVVKSHKDLGPDRSVGPHKMPRNSGIIFFGPSTAARTPRPPFLLARRTVPARSLPLWSTQKNVAKFRVGG